MEHIVIKGVDDEIEFKGFKGRYFYQIVGLVIVLIFSTFLLYAVGFTSIWLFLSMLILGVLGFIYIQGKQDKNKKYGHIYSSHTPPKNIIQKSNFHNFIK